MGGQSNKVFVLLCLCMVIIVFLDWLLLPDCFGVVCS